MIREEPFPVRRGKQTEEEWAREVMRLWVLDGSPELDGPPADQIHVARDVMERTAIARRKGVGEDRDKPATKKGKQ